MTPPGDAEVKLLVQSESVRPGETFSVAVANDGEHRVRYGTRFHIEDAETGKTLPEPKGPFLAVGLLADPGEVGPCVRVWVPGRTDPGSYRVVLVDASEELAAEFAVQGAPTRE